VYKSTLATRESCHSQHQDQTQYQQSLHFRQDTLIYKKNQPFNMKISIIALALATSASAWEFSFGGNRSSGGRNQSCRRADLRRDREYRYEAQRQQDRPDCCLRLYRDDDCKDRKREVCGNRKERFGQDFKSWNVVCR
jgi:hypothetical protein